jgi:hemoglobin
MIRFFYPAVPPNIRPDNATCAFRKNLGKEGKSLDEVTLKPSSQKIVDEFLTRRGIIGGALAAGAALLTFEFVKTPEVSAQQLTSNSLYDQLGGLVGITAVINDFIPIVASDGRINRFFADTVKSGRIPRLKELLIQQIAEASGGPVKYTGADMKSAHAGMGIPTTAFVALVGDLTAAMDKNNVSDNAKRTLLGALAPLAPQIVENPFA